MPRRNSSPAIWASRALEATVIPIAPPPARIRWPGSTWTWLIALGSRTTTPGTPPSRTIRLEPTPTGMTGTDGSSSRRKRAKSSTSLGRTSHSAGPPVRNQMKSASEPLGSTLPSRRGSSITPLIPPDKNRCQTPNFWGGRSFLTPRAGDAVCEAGGPFGDVAGAEADHHVAGRGEVAQAEAEVVEVPNRLHRPVAPLLQPLGQGLGID